MSHPSHNAFRVTLLAWWRAAMRLLTRLLGEPTPAHGAAQALGDAPTHEGAPPHGEALPLEVNSGGAQPQDPGQFIPINELQCLDNFYQLEVADVWHWRWTGPGCSFSLFAPVTRDRDQTIVIEALGTPSAINWGNTFLEVEDEMLLCEHKEVNGLHWLAAPLPARLQSNGAFVRYHLQDSRCPAANADGSRDGRKLGIALTGLRIIPN